MVIKLLKIKVTTHPVFSLSHLVHSELLTTRAHHDESLDLVMYLVCLGVRLLLLPVRPQSCYELVPVDHTLRVVVEHIGHGVHLQPACVEL